MFSRKEAFCRKLANSCYTRQTMDQVADVRAKTDIVGLIGSFISLKKAGNNFKSNCPFHEENSPSFVVSPERQIWHCFGCGKGGDAFSFLMEYEHIEFPEALRILADKAGVKLRNQHIDGATSSKKETFYALNSLAAEFYHYLLTKHQLGKEALTYVLEKRRVKVQTLKTFLIGYAPWGSALTTYLIKKKGYKLQDILEVGLATKRANGAIMDFFQDRLVFALYDHRDNIVGFSGRILNNSDKTSKYINTKETLIYHKGMTFFGFNTAKDAIKKENLAILMEGELDVISAFQEGVTNVIAVKGTAVTEDQVNLLSRFCQKVALCFDMDNAGQEALKRSLILLEKKSFTTSVVVLKNGKDADEVIQNDPSAFFHAVKHPEHVYDYLLNQVLVLYDRKSIDGKKKISDVLLPLFGNINNEIVKEHYLKQLAESIDTSQESLEKEINKRKKEEHLLVKVQKLIKTPRSREEILEEYLLSLIVQSPQAIALLEQTENILQHYQWQTPAYEKILQKIKNTFTNQALFDQQKFVQGLSEELLPIFDRCFLLPLPVFDQDTYPKEVLKIAKEMQQSFLKNRLKFISTEIKQKEKAGENEAAEKLQEEFALLLANLSEKKP